jgi:uncharacterized Zn-binding protein involved in type VI secretion
VIPGVTAVGEAAIAELPGAISDATPNPMSRFFEDASSRLIYALVARPYSSEPGMSNYIRFRGGWDNVECQAYRTEEHLLTGNDYSVSMRVRLHSIPKEKGTWHGIGGFKSGSENPKFDPPESNTITAYFAVDAEGVVWWIHRGAPNLEDTLYSCAIPLGTPVLGEWFHILVTARYLPSESLLVQAYMGGRLSGEEYIAAYPGPESGGRILTSGGMVLGASTEGYPDVLPATPGAYSTSLFGDITRLRVWDGPLTNMDAVLDASGLAVGEDILVQELDFTRGEGPWANSGGEVGFPWRISEGWGLRWGDGGPGDEVCIRLASEEYRTGPDDDPPNTLFPAVLTQPYSAEVSIIENGAPVSGAAPGIGNVTIANPNGDLDWITSLSWYGRPVEIRVGVKDVPFREWAPIYHGAAEALSWDYDSITLVLRPPSAGLSVPVQKNRFGGRGSCLRFDGVDDYASATISPQGGPNGTIEFWIRLLENPGNPVVALSLGNLAGTLYVKVTSAGKVQVAIDGSTVATVDDPLVIGEWTHFAWTIKSGTHTIYINGTQVVMVDGANWSGSLSGAFRIGGQGRNYMKGELDEIRIWSVARERVDIRTDMRMPLTGVESGLASYWRLDEGTGSTAANAVSGKASLSISGATWVGTNEGQRDLCGVQKPLIYGAVKHFEPVLIDAARLIYQVHDGPIETMIAYDSGVALTDNGDTSDLFGASVASGKFKTDKGRGLFRLGSGPTGPLTVSAGGDATDGYTNVAGEIIRRIALRAGLREDQIDAGALNALSVARPGAIGLLVEPEMTAEDAITRICHSVGAYWTFSRKGLLSVGIVGQPETSLVEVTEADFEDGSLERTPAATPVKSWAVGYGRNYRVFSPEEIAGAILTFAPGTWLDLQREYRWAFAESVLADLTHATADEVFSEGLYYEEAPARAEARRFLDLFSGAKDIYTLTLIRWPHTFEIGDTVALKIPRYGLEEGRSFIVVGWEENAGEGGTRVTLWG